jgi:hypothetical protein
VRKGPYGRTLHAASGYDEGVLSDIRKWFEAHDTIRFALHPVADSYLSHGGTAVPCRRPRGRRGRASPGPAGPRRNNPNAAGAGGASR